MPFKLAVAVRGTVAGHRLGAPRAGGGRGLAVYQAWQPILRTTQSLPQRNMGVCSFAITKKDRKMGLPRPVALAPPPTTPLLQLAGFFAKQQAVTLCRNAPPSPSCSPTHWMQLLRGPLPFTSA